MTPNERKLVAALLDLASDRFANHGCNDFPIGEYLSKPERVALNKAMHEANGDPEEHDPEEAAGSVWAADWWLMAYFADKIRGGS